MSKAKKIEWDNREYDVQTIPQALKRRDGSYVAVSGILDSYTVYGGENIWPKTVQIRITDPRDEISKKMECFFMPEDYSELRWIHNQTHDELGNFLKGDRVKVFGVIKDGETFNLDKLLKIEDTSGLALCIKGKLAKKEQDEINPYLVYDCPVL